MSNADLFAALTDLKAAWPVPGWSWDGRFSTAASSFGAELAPQLRGVAAVLLPRHYDSATLATAPPVLRALVERSGGLRGSQLAFCDGGDVPRMFGLWWPWGGGATISLRLGLIDADAASVAQLRALFGV